MAAPALRPKGHGLYAASFLVAAFFFCGTCNSCDAPAPGGDLPTTASLP